MSARVVEADGRRALVRVLELADASFEQSNVLLEETRSGDLCTGGILAVIRPAVGNAAPTCGLVAVAFLFVRIVSNEPLVEEGYAELHVRL